jgi:hypothetical protein
MEEILWEWYGIMPNKVLYDQELTPTQKLIFIVVSSLCAERWYCRASNSYIGDMLWISINTTSEAINKLIDKWYLHSVVDKKEGNKRILTLSEKIRIPIPKNSYSYPKKLVDINTIDNYKWIIDKNNTKSFWEGNELEERKEKSCEKKKRKKVEYTQDYETIWKIYPQNWWVKEKIFPLWQWYDDEKKEKLLFWAKVIRLRYMTWWRYVQRMDRWMEWYSPWEEFEKLCEVKRTIDNLKDDTLKESCYHELREMFGDEMNRKVAFATTKKIEFEWH